MTTIHKLWGKHIRTLWVISVCNAQCAYKQCANILLCKSFYLTNTGKKHCKVLLPILPLPRPEIFQILTLFTEQCFLVQHELRLRRLCDYVSQQSRFGTDRRCAEPEMQSMIFCAVQLDGDCQSFCQRGFENLENLSLLAGFSLILIPFPHDDY